ncbi:hypothetical protein HK097_006495 [Rhizophlyctis rosea]|uniref:Aprataxin n=1 Tax=Rhizophlyctis rosea TaxID=64517 RepID=A0AAD5SFP2_9FUNG|nr:hypothetical protein HK097_006495 [Rhizophlyctis rosea]
MHQITIVQDTGDRHVLVKKGDSDQKGSIKIGRKTFGITAKRCSREQVEVQYDGSKGTVSVTQLGPNTSAIKRNGADEDMVRNKEYELHHGDGFYLLQGEHSFTVEIDPVPKKAPAAEATDSDTNDDEAPPQKSDAPAKKRASLNDDASAPPSKKAKPAPPKKSQPTRRIVKRKNSDEDDDVYGDADSDDYFDPDDPAFVVPDDADEDDDDDDDDDDDGEFNDEGDEDEDVRRVCMYGKKCYRNNPQHFLEFAHPWLDKDKKKGSDGGSGKRRKRDDAEDDDDDLDAPAKSSKSQRGGGSSRGRGGGGGPGAISDRVRTAKRKRVNYNEDDDDDEEDFAVEEEDEPQHRKRAPAADKKKPADTGGAWIPKRKKHDVTDDEGDDGVRKSSSVGSPAGQAKEEEAEDDPFGSKMDLDPPPPKPKPSAPAPIPAPTSIPSSKNGNPETGTINSLTSAPVEADTRTRNDDPKPGGVQLQRGRSNVSNPSEHRKERSLTPVMTRGSSNLSSEDGAGGAHEITRLGIPSISTNEGKVPGQQAVAIATKLFASFLKEHENVEIVLGDSDGGVVSAFKKAMQSEKRFSTIGGDLSRMKTDHRLKCQYLVVETSWRWKPTATSQCKAVYDRAGPTLAESVKARYGKPAQVGEAYPVEIDKSSPLYEEEGVVEVIHIVGPNLNPNRPHCLESDDATEKALEQLQTSYKAVLGCFAERAGLGTPEASEGKGKGKDKSLFDVLMNRTTPPSVEAPPIKSPAKGHYDYDKFKGGTNKGFSGGWSDALRPYCENPEKFSGKEVVDFDAEVVVVRDKFGKSKHHYLILPRRPIDSLASLKPSDIPILEKLKQRADRLVSDVLTSIGGKADVVRGEQDFRAGFHAVPSMKQVHLHVISQDFSTDAFKNKKHWNSFTTEFFKPWEDMVGRLKREGKVLYDPAEHEALLKGPLKCHRCGRECKTIPDVKKHIKACEG